MIEREEAIKQDDLAGRPQASAAIGIDQINRRALYNRLFHLAGDGALPDQIIELCHIGFEPHFRRMAVRVSWPNCFMCFLRIFGFRAVIAWFFGHIFAAKSVADHSATLHDRGLIHRDAVGPHIGDQADGFAANVDTLIQSLCHLHGPLRVKT